MGKSVYEQFGHSTISGSDQTQRRHVVSGNETLPGIASDEYRVEYDQELWRQIAEANGIDDLDAITVGTVLTIPTPQQSST